MTLAAAIESRTAKATAQSRASRISSIDILGDLDQAEAIWRRLEDGRQLFTPYQRFEFLSSWQRCVGKGEHASPLIVIGYDTERRPLLMLPLSLRTVHGLRTASFMGGKHVTFNMALWDREFATTATSADLNALISLIRSRNAADVLVMTRQPRRWHEVSNPMALLPNQPSVNGCPVLTIEPGAASTALVSNSLRRRLKGKERKLQALPGYRYYLATDDVDIQRLLDWFFCVKPLRMAEQKLPDVFADPGVKVFIRESCRKSLVRGGRAIALHALECHEEVIALFAGVADGHRFSMMFNTYTMSENSRFSPGLILIRNIIDHYAEQSYRAIDLGIGSDDYKRMFCKTDEPIFDSFIALSPLGQLGAPGMSALNRAKHLVKNNQILLRCAQALRGGFQESPKT
jgi:CelD/BcsL family acetyltransferase involved in cellulose biosynthesis